MNVNLFDAAAAAPTGTDGGSVFMIIIIYAAVFALLYLFLIRPKSKRQKQEQKMRENLDIGDEITTIGGIMGRVVAIRDDEDAIIIETGSDRVKMKLKRWCISTVDTEKEVPETKEKKSRFFGKKEKKDEKKEEKK